MRQIVVLGTGGTISGESAPGQGPLSYQAGRVGVDQLLAGLPVSDRNAITWEQLAQVDSKDMGFALWQQLVTRCAHWLAQPQVAGLVVTHGTDTAEETAWFLQRVLGPRKPVAIACAMRPADAPSADGPGNLIEAIALAREPGAMGVLLPCAGTVHGAEDVRKVHPTRLDAFGSGEAGPVAVFEGESVRPLRAWPQPADGPSLLAKVAGASDWPWVEIVASGAGVDGRAVNALVQAGVQGLVVAATGNGSVHQALEGALLDALQAGVKIVRSTRCETGRVVTLPGDRFVASPRTPAKARVDLLLDLLD